MENFEKRNTEQDSYKTGSTNPARTRGGLVAVLLVAVILLAGVSSILGVMNIQLFQMLQAEKKHPVSFAPSETKVVTTEPTRDATGKPELGLTVDSIGELDQRYFHLPAGALITQVDAQGCAASAGLAVGDIILAFNELRVQTAAELEILLQTCQVGDRVEVEFYRYRTEQKLKTTVILEARG